MGFTNRPLGCKTFFFFLYKVLFNVCVFLLLSVLIEMLDKWQNLGLKFARNKLFQISVAIVISFFFITGEHGIMISLFPCIRK